MNPLKAITLGFLLFIICFQSLQAQQSISLQELETQKAKAIAEQDYEQAAKIHTAIKEWKEKDIQEKAAAESFQKRKLAKAAEIAALEKEKAAAVAKQDYQQAGEINKKIKKLNELEVLEKEKAAAIAQQDYVLAGHLKIKIKKLNEIEELEWQKKTAVAQQDYQLASELSKKIIALKEDKPMPSANGSQGSSGLSGVSNSIVYTKTEKSKIRHAEENASTAANYRRSSLYSIMLLDTARLHAESIAKSFVDFPLPGKFNDHDLDNKVIPTSGSGYALTSIDEYLNTNAVARQLVAKWFNRNSKGTFSMDVVAKRGNYNASVSDLRIAALSARGNALLSDAGEDLISGTFVVVNDFSFTNKEEVANKAKTGLLLLGIAGDLAGVDNASTITSIASAGVTVAGKGYIIKNTSYLFRLVWNEEIAAQFYENYWMDESSFDPKKKEAFDNSTLFTLKYIGQENSWADLQSSSFTSKTEEELISSATLKSINSGIAKLQRKFEEFRTKTPLLSTNPITASIGMKEGVEAGDSFEVLEAYKDPTGKVTYLRKGIIRATNNIWDNRMDVSEMSPGTAVGNQFTIFKGADNLLYPGMLIRQIN